MFRHEEGLKGGYTTGVGGSLKDGSSTLRCPGPVRKERSKEGRKTSTIVVRGSVGRVFRHPGDLKKEKEQGTQDQS